MSAILDHVPSSFAARFQLRDDEEPQRRHRFKGKHRGAIQCPCNCGMTFKRQRDADTHAATKHEESES